MIIESWFNNLREEEWVLHKDGTLIAGGAIVTKINGEELLTEEKARIETYYAIQRMKHLDICDRFETWLKHGGSHE